MGKREERGEGGGEGGKGRGWGEEGEKGRGWERGRGRGREVAERQGVTSTRTGEVYCADVRSQHSNAAI